MIFYEPRNLWYLILIPPLAYFFYHSYPRRVSDVRILLGKNFTAQMALAFRIYYTASAFCFLFGLAALALAMSKPLWGGNVKSHPADSTFDLMFVLDVSKSMLAEDIKPSRFERAVLLLQELHEAFAAQRQGLAVFKGTAQTLIPLTEDKKSFQFLFPLLSSKMIDSPGSNLPEGIQEAMKQLQAGPGHRSVIILLSDGETLTGQISPVFDDLLDWDGTVISIGVGTEKGMELYDEQQNLILDQLGLPVISKLQRGILELASRNTKGIYHSINEPDLASKIIQELAPFRYGNEISRYNLQDRFQFFVILSLLSFFTLFGLRRFGFIGIYHKLRHYTDLYSGEDQ